MHTAQLAELSHNGTARHPDAHQIVTRRYVSEPLMSHHSTPALALAAALALTGVSVDKIAQANSLIDVNRIYKDSALVIP